MGKGGRPRAGAWEERGRKEVRGRVEGEGVREEGCCQGQACLRCAGEGEGVRARG